jgi:hypothetical protein
LTAISSNAGENDASSQLSFSNRSTVLLRQNNATIQQDLALGSASPRRRCALNFYGLPRAFKDMVLPSLKANVIPRNARYGCDYFVHFYNVTYEAPSRSGKGGIIVPEDVYLLRQAVHDEALRTGRPLPYVGFTLDTEESFERNQRDILQLIRKNYTDVANPFFSEQKSFTVETYVNIIRMWYSIAAAWESMEKHASSHGFKYERVAMMRSDVVYLTTIDVFIAAPASDALSEVVLDTLNNQAIMPGFAKYPVNDRMFYGPYEAVKIWATGRFSRLEDYVYRLGKPLHSERFLEAMILPAIRERAISVGEDPRICFLRARADRYVWNDCRQGASKKILERLLKVSCMHDPEMKIGVPRFICSKMSRNWQLS